MSIFRERTSDGKVVLYELATGQRFVRWPVDAREMLRSGEYTQDAPADTVAEASEAAGVALPSTVRTEGAAQSGAVPLTPLGMPVVVIPASGGLTVTGVPRVTRVK